MERCDDTIEYFCEPINELSQEAIISKFREANIAHYLKLLNPETSSQAILEDSDPGSYLNLLGSELARRASKK